MCVILILHKTLLIMLILHKFRVKYNTNLVVKITQFVCYILHIICVYKIQTTQNPKFFRYTREVRVVILESSVYTYYT